MIMEQEYNHPYEQRRKSDEQYTIQTLPIPGYPGHTDFILSIWIATTSRWRSHRPYSV